MCNILILGGAGFIGSNLVSYFINKGYKITVIDGLLKNSGGKRENISGLLNEVNFIDKKIEDVVGLPEIIKKNEIIIDSMAWTCHLSAMKNPFYDLNLNVNSHLYFLEQVRKSNVKPKKIIYLGSRTQYGNPINEKITEDTPMNPLDIQGVHKVTAENYFKIYSEIHELNTVSLRMVGVYGKNQPYDREDLGLIGNLIRQGLKEKKITIYGKDRRREIIYVNDLVKIIYELIKVEISGFTALNIGGDIVSIDNMGQKIIENIGAGFLHYKGLPKEIENIDIKNYIYSINKVESLIGKIHLSDLDETFHETIKYFKKKFI